MPSGSERPAPGHDEPTDALPRTDVDLESEIESLRDFITKGGPTPLNHRLFLDIEETESRFEHILALLPKEVRRARRICRDEQRIVQDAKDEARRLLEEARAEAEQMVTSAREDSEQCLTQAREEADRLVEASAIRHRALEQSEAMLARAEQTAKDVRDKSYAYADQVIGNVVESLRRLARTVEQDKLQLEQSRAEDERAAPAE
jgi:F0F1-type ATP synthase membrane subunit b/b'